MPIRRLFYSLHRIHRMTLYCRMTKHLSYAPFSRCENKYIRCLRYTRNLSADRKGSRYHRKQIKPEIGYHIRADKQRNGFAKEAAIAVRDWTFNNTPFNVIYSYMKHTNEPSVKTAVSYGCKQVDEFKDDVNEITKVFAISRDEWINR